MLGFILAHLMHNIPGGKQRIWRGLLLVPWVIPLALSTLGWWWLFDPLLLRLQLGAEPSASPACPGSAWRWTARFCMIAVNVWYGTPFFMIMYLAALKSVPEQLYEAAAIDGAGAVQKLFFVTLPMMRNIIAITVLFSLIVTFAEFRHRAHPHQRRAAGHDARVRHLCLPGRHPVRRYPARRLGQPVHVADPGRLRLLRSARRDAARQGDGGMSGAMRHRRRVAAAPRRGRSLHRQRLWALWASYAALACSWSCSWCRPST